MKNLDGSASAVKEWLLNIPEETLSTLSIVSLGISLFAIMLVYVALQRAKRSADPRVVSNTIHDQLETLRCLVHTVEE